MLSVRTWSLTSVACVFVAGCGRPPEPEPPGILSGAGQVGELTLSTWVGCETEATLELTNVGEGPLELEAPRWLSGNLDFVEVRDGGPGVLAAGETRVVTLAAARLEEDDYGPYSGRVRLGGEGQWFEVEVSYASATPSLLLPDQMTFGAVNVGDSSVQEFIYRNLTDVPTWYELGPLTDGDPLTFPGFDSAVRYELDPAEAVTVPVTFSPSTPGEHLAFLRMRIPLWCREFSMNIQLTGTGVE